MSDQKTILVIDDEEDLQQLVKMTLKSKGYNVVVAGNGIEGLEKLETIKPDLIVLDMNMPKMGGLEFYQKICVHGHPEYPILVLTARANMEQLFKEFNIDGFMAKPFEIDEILDEVETIIRKSSQSDTQTTLAGAREVKSVCIVEDDTEVLNQIGSIFLSEGFTVNPSRNGVEGIERIANTIPQIALIKLCLLDISGDIVIGKLKRMAKTENIKYILYTDKKADKTSVVKRIGEKEGIDCFVEISSPKDLLAAVEELQHA